MHRQGKTNRVALKLKILRTLHICMLWLGNCNCSRPRPITKNQQVTNSIQFDLLQWKRRGFRTRSSFSFLELLNLNEESKQHDE